MQPATKEAKAKLSGDVGAAPVSTDLVEEIGQVVAVQSAQHCRCCLVSRGTEPALGRSAVYRLCVNVGDSLPAAVSIGRRPDAEIVLRHGSASRHQLTLLPIIRHSTSSGWDWRAVDCGSANGTFVNGRRIPASASTNSDLASAAKNVSPLRCGDRISVGPLREAVLCLEFVAADCPLHRPAAVAECDAAILAINATNSSTHSNRKRSSDRSTDKLDGRENVASPLAPTAPKRMAPADADVASNSNQRSSDAAEVAAMRLELERLRDQLAEKDRALAEQERQMRQRLADEVEALEADRLAVMAGLEAEMRKEMADRDAEHEALLQRERARLEQALRDKEAKQAVLEGELSKARDAAATAGGVTPEARADIMRSLAEVLETELNCPICCDLLVDAATMPCSHTFCRYCIEEWLRRKNECPQCRAAGNGVLSRALVVDSYVDRMVAELAPERRAERDARVAEQRDKLAKLQGRKRPRVGQPSQHSQRQPVTASNATTAASTSQHQGQPPASAAAAATVAAAAAGPSSGRSGAAAVVVSSSSDNSDTDGGGDSDSEYDDDETSGGYDSDLPLHGNPRAYYGGYGRCYNCGRRGHWANGCPF